MSKIYPGTSAFFANRTGKHNWLDNNARPFLSVITTRPDGKREYTDLFLNKDKSIEVKSDDNTITISFPANTNQPIFRVLTKGETS